MKRRTRIETPLRDEAAVEEGIVAEEAAYINAVPKVAELLKTRTAMKNGVQIIVST